MMASELLMRTEGVRISQAPLFDANVGAAFEAELDIYVAAIVELAVLTPSEFAARYIDYSCDVRELAAHARRVLASQEAESLLASLSKHGIFKCAGAGGVCALVKTEPLLEKMARDALEEAGLEVPSYFYCSWDSVCFLGPSQVTDTACPSWLHRDIRLGVGASDGVQLMVNLSPCTQDGPAGDACFVYVPRSHDCPEARRTVEEFVAAGADRAAIAKLFKTDFVQARLVVRQGDKAEPEKSLLWPRGSDAPSLVRATIPARGAVAWDSRLLHSGSLFTKPGRPHPRRTKYVHYFGISKDKAAARVQKLALTKSRHFTLAMVRGDESYTEERFALEFPGVSPRVVYPIAVTTAHRGTRKNNSGKFDTFRSGKRERMLTELNERLDHPMVRNFFSLPFMLARSLQLLYPAELAATPCAQVAEACILAMQKVPEQLHALSPAAAERITNLAYLHGM